MKEVLFNELNNPVRSSYIADIRNIVPMDDNEARDINETLTWIGSANKIHKPYNMDRHLGVLFLPLSPDKKQIYLINHKKAQMWIPPGGHVDEGLTFQQAVELEMQEELQATAKFINSSPFFLTQTLTQGINAGHVDVTAWFLVEGDPEQNYHIQAKEANQGSWFDLNSNVAPLKSQHLSRMLRKLHDSY